ncbi:MAG: hypothetical protein KatS3mg076_1157 [Candidatus Binatia bacterium]|nr:MAG: hypothetical protein KatS3mg076_1157 [Candidatus Binatia bacterium]
MDSTGTILVGVQLSPVGRIYFCRSTLPDLRCGDEVIAAIGDSTSLARVVLPPRPETGAVQTAGRVLRRATERDRAVDEAQRALARRVLRDAAELVSERRWPLKVVDADARGTKRVRLYLVRTGKADFTTLRREVESRHRLAVELQFLGARDETKRLGGTGPCGRELCCSTFLRDFSPVTLEMGKLQGMSPSRVAGLCGKLKCCLRYEYETYRELARPLPPLGARVETLKGEGTVVGRDVLRQTVVVRTNDGSTEFRATLQDLVARVPTT